MSLNEIRELLIEPRLIVITAHQNPDGDAIGSSLGLYHWLKKIANHTIKIIVPNDYPDFLHFMPGDEEVNVYYHNKSECDKWFKSAQIAFILDYNAPDRIGEMGFGLSKVPGIKIMIDHHLFPVDFVDYAFSDTSASSTSEMIYTFMNDLGFGESLNPDSATCLFAGIVSDTGGYKHALTPSVFNITSQLLSTGIDANKINNALFNNFSDIRLKLFGYTLYHRMELIPDKHAAIMYLDEDDRKMLGFSPGDTEGLVNYALLISWVQVAVLLTVKDSLVKLSFRSKGSYNVQELCQKHFQGGGHFNASGGRSTLSVADTILKVKEVLHPIANPVNNG